MIQPNMVNVVGVFADAPISAKALKAVQSVDRSLIAFLSMGISQQMIRLWLPPIGAGG